MSVAKIFWSGRSQAVSLPEEFRFDTAEVRIRRHGNGVILEPVPEDRDWLKNVIGPVDADFEAAATEDVADQERPSLDFFK